MSKVCAWALGRGPLVHLTMDSVLSHAFFTSAAMQFGQLLTHLDTTQQMMASSLKDNTALLTQVCGAFYFVATFFQGRARQGGAGHLRLWLFFFFFLLLAETGGVGQSHSMSDWPETWFVDQADPTFVATLLLPPSTGIIGMRYHA